SILCLHHPDVRRVALRGDVVASAGLHGDVRLWRGAERISRGSEGHTGAATAVTFLPDGRLVSGGEDGLVKIWDLGSGRVVAMLGASSSVISLALSGDGRW